MAASLFSRLAASTGRRRRLATLSTALVVGLLLWARLIVSTDMPRMAIANDIAADRPVARAASPRTATDKDAEFRTHDLPDSESDRDPFLMPETYVPAGTSISDIQPDPEKSTAQVTEDPR